MDTGLRPPDPTFALQRALRAEALLEPLAIIEPFDTRNDLVARCVPRVRRLLMDPFMLERAQEALRHRVVIPGALPTHTRRDAERDERLLRGTAAVLRPVIRVMESAGTEASLANRPRERREGQLLIRFLAHGPADHPTRLEIEPHRDIAPARSGGDPRDSSPPDPVQCRRDASLWEQVRSRRRQRLRLDDHAAPPHPPGFHLPHLAEPGDPMPSASNAPAPGLSPVRNGTLLFPHCLMELAETRPPPLIRNRPRTWRPLSPGIVPTAAHREGCTAPRDSIGLFMSPNRRVLHVDSLATYAAAFFTRSRSSVTRARSRRTRARSAVGSACRPEPGKAPPGVATAFCQF